MWLLTAVAAACWSGSALAQDGAYDPQSGSETGPYQIPHTGLFKGGKF
jgi:hypothetical protein